MENLPSQIRGPKLSRFKGDLADAQFVKLLSSGDDQDSDGTPHSRVFLVTIKDKRYTVKIFSFVALDDIRPFVPTKEHLIDDIVVREQIDPFFAECRAFGLLVKDGKDHELAVRCYGYAILSEEVERRIGEEFGIRDWNRSMEHHKEPLRAIVKDYIRYLSFDKPKRHAKMRENLVELNKMGIYNMDIRKENYLGGRLFDFSTAMTAPHLSFWIELRDLWQIKEDMDYDRWCFDFMIETANAEKSKNDVMNRNRWKNLRSRSVKKTPRKRWTTRKGR
ncbi:kinetochore Sim4 complex subunit FTA2-domain-containing protein [Xylaria palmicola]|nr:kinetochore Sim4 complex subunit FTA2-domain-containing protein [Xylaria palmicola]